MELDQILLVDDEADIRRIGQFSLTAIGKLRVITAASGAEALEIAARELPDAILLDVMMPGLDGPDVLIRLRESEATRAIPVIFMTAKVQRSEVERYLQLGARGVINKPFDPMTLPRRVRDILMEGSPAPAPISAPVLDRSALSQLRALETASGSALVNELLEMFAAQTPPRLERLRAALAGGDVLALENESHALRGNSGALGLLRLHEACGELEQAAHDRRDGVLPALVAQVIASTHEGLAALTAEHDSWT